ncbi:MAG: hypothetical protein ACKVQW_14120 [Pyrinomonadaceae bacterium]
MKIQDTRFTAELSSSVDLNKYLTLGWVLILSYVKHKNDSQEPRFVVGWQHETPPVYPEMLDEWERREMRRQRNP